MKTVGRHEGMTGTEDVQCKVEPMAMATLADSVRDDHITNSDIYTVSIRDATEISSIWPYPTWTTLWLCLWTQSEEKKPTKKRDVEMIDIMRKCSMEKFITKHTHTHTERKATLLKFTPHTHARTHTCSVTDSINNKSWKQTLCFSESK